MAGAMADDHHRDLTSSVNYGTSAKAGPHGDWPILRMGNVTDEGRLDTTDLKYIDLPEADVPKYTTQRGDLLFNRTNSKEKVGKSAVVDTDEAFAVAGYLVRVRLRTPYRPEFVSSYLMSTHGQTVRRRLAKAAVNQANISAKEMRNIPIADVPGDLQARFAEQVQKLETVRSRYLRHLTELDRLFASLQARAFRGEL